jgi:hypothetical protein
MPLAPGADVLVRSMVVDSLLHLVIPVVSLATA